MRDPRTDSRTKRPTNWQTSKPARVATQWGMLLGALAAVGIAGRAAAQEWTRFRGPNGSGIGSATNLPSQWQEQDYNWRTALPGAGHSSPVIWGDRVFVGTADPQAGRAELVALGVDQGEILWRAGVALPSYHKHDYNTYASGSPTVDAQRVYVCWAFPDAYTVAAFDHAGKPAWTQNLGPFASQHGGGHSPILHHGLLIAANEQDGQSFIVAMDAQTGKIRWKTPRRTKEAAYATPCVFEPKGGSPELIFNSESHGISGIDPVSGQVLWELTDAFDKRVVSSPVVAGDLIIGACGSGGGGNYVVAVRPGDPARGLKPERVFTVRRSAPYVPTSVYRDGLLFLWSDGGIVSCVDAVSGEIKYQERVGGNYFSSPVLTDSRLFGISSRGEVVVVQASTTFKVLARNALNELTHSTPAIAGGRMYIHTSQHLISIGGEKKSDGRKAKTVE